MDRAGMRHSLLALLTVGLLAGCQDGQNPFAALTQPKADAAEPGADTDAPVAGDTSTRIVDRDVEAPEVFQVTDQALWDGRPSLGGVWVASPDAVDPERVILRNPGNGKFVIGALFRRERDNPGPALQISSDAAAALGILAGQPAKINVTALRREEAPVTAPDAAKPILDAAEGVGTTTLANNAGAAVDRAAAAAPAAPAAAAPAPAKPETPAKPAASGGAHRVQIGIFSVEANATRAVDMLKKAGITASVRPGNTQGKPFWSVTAQGGGDRAALLNKIKGLGFADAYFLK